MTKPFLPADFVVPAGPRTSHFHLRGITVADVVKDYAAVMTSRERLWSLFGEAWGWPAEDLSFEQDLADLGWHQVEAQHRASFNYAVLDLDERELLGCVYIDPPSGPGFDAEVCYWIRSDRLDGGLEEDLGAAVRAWLRDEWPFAAVAYPGREITWSQLRAPPVRPSGR